MMSTSASTYISTLLLFLGFLFSVIPSSRAAKFSVNGPVLTVTLKEPEAAPPTINLRDATVAEAFSAATAKPAPPTRKWMDLSALRPNLYWSIQSNSPPLPNWIPFWTSLRANVGYQYEELKTLPAFVVGELKFRSERLNAELEIKPSYEFKPKRTNLLIQASRGASYVMAQFSMMSNKNKLKAGAGEDDSDFEDLSSSTSSQSTTAGSFLEYVRASYDIQFPAGSQISNLRITPSLDITKQEPSCVLESTTGGSGRTKATLRLNYNNPTLAVTHALDERNIISPEISLYNAKIIYKWKVQLDRGGVIQTRVDPTSAIDVTWTDTSAADGGRWVTDFRLPLEGTTIHALASDVRVRRQFNF